MVRIGRRILGLVRYGLGHLARRDPRLWVFGNSKGFRDNPRYLIEHVVAEVPTIRPWWIARTQREADAARAAGVRVALRSSREAVELQQRAGVAFLSNGFQDLEPDRLGGAFVVDLRHGKGLKRVLLDLREGAPRGPLGWFGERLRRVRITRRLAQVNMIVAPGEMAAEMYRTAFAGPASRIRVLGSPRFDVILGGPAYDRAAGPDPAGRVGIAEGDHVVLWLPTWREGGDAGWLPRLSDGELESSLAGTRVVILVKPHPFSAQEVFAERLPQGRHLRLLPEQDVDANCLLRLADALVTDFSSAAFDFALLDRPIHFLVPDIEDYRDGTGLYEPLETLTGGRQHIAWPSLLAEVRASALGQDPTDRDTARRIRRRAALLETPGSCARIVDAVAEEMGLAPGPAGARAAGEPVAHRTRAR